MGFFGDIIGWALLGLVAGAIARAIYPGKQDINLVGTIGLGILGSFIGGAIFKAIPITFWGAGIAFAVLGAIIAIFVYYKVTGKSAA